MGFSPICDHPRFFLKNQALSLLYPYGALTSCKKLEKTYELSLRYLKTDEHTDGRTQGPQGRLLRTPTGKPGVQNSVINCQIMILIQIMQSQLHPTSKHSFQTTYQTSIGFTSRDHLIPLYYQELESRLIHEATKVVASWLITAYNHDWIPITKQQRC